MQAAREARRREVALERERKAALMHTLFTQGTRGEPTKTTEIGELPESWEVVRLGTLISDGPQNGLYKHSSYYGTGTPILRIDAFEHGDIIQEQGLKRLRLDESEISSYILREGDFVVNRVNGNPDLVGKCALVGNIREPTVFESNMMRFSVDDSQIDQLYLIYFLGFKLT